MTAVTLQPAAGAQGELTGILMIRAYHRSRGDLERTEVLVPDSSPRHEPGDRLDGRLPDDHDPVGADGGVDLDAFRAALGPRTAAVMITNPSTLGLFESRIGELLEAVHAAGALAYMDGANLNAILGRFKPGEAGFDVMHINIHKTFSTPHGGGGPGAGPVGVGRDARAVPARAAGPARADDGTFRLERPGRAADRASAGCAASSATPASSCAPTPTSAPTAATGLREVSDDAVLAANYLKAPPGRRPTTSRTSAHCKHEFVASAATIKKETGVRTLDIAKRLIDYGFHPPTIYFPLIVEEGMLIEPTETESVETLDAFADALIAIAGEARRDARARPRGARTRRPVRRLDEATAARQPNLRWRAMTGAETPCPD